MLVLVLSLLTLGTPLSQLLSGHGPHRRCCNLKNNPQVLSKSLVLGVVCLVWFGVGFLFCFFSFRSQREDEQ